MGLSRAGVQKRIAKGLAELQRNLRRKGAFLTLAGLETLLSSEVHAATATPAFLSGVGKTVLATSQIHQPLSAMSALAQGVITVSTKKMAITGLIVLAALIVGTLALMKHSSRGTSHDSAPPQVALESAPASSWAKKPLESTAGDDSEALSDTEQAENTSSDPSEPVAAASTPGESSSQESVTSNDRGSGVVTIRGTVLDHTAYPVPDARLIFVPRRYGDGDARKAIYAPGAESSTTADADGTYALKARVTEGLAGSVRVAAEGFFMQERDVDQASPGKSVTGFDFTLAPVQHVVKGIVLSADGRPVADAVVVLESILFSPDSHNRTRSQSWSPGSQFAVTGVDGTFELGVPKAGLCTFLVSAEGFGSSHFGGIATGTEDARFTLNLPGGISGKVTLKDGSAAPGRRIAVVGQCPDGPGEVSHPVRDFGASAVSDQHGTYVLEGLSANMRYDVGVIGSATDAQTREPVQTVSMTPGDAIGMDFLMVSPLAIPVRVVDEANQPLSGIPVALGYVEPDGRWDATIGQPAPTDEMGQCIMTGLPPDRSYFVWAEAETQEGSVQVPVPLAQAGPISAGNGNPAPEVVLVIAQKGGLEGVLTDADGNPMAEVPLVIAAERADGATTDAVHVQTGPAGEFTVMYAFVPGTYANIHFTVPGLEDEQVASVSDIAIQQDTIVDMGTVTVRARDASQEK